MKITLFVYKVERGIEFYRVYAGIKYLRVGSCAVGRLEWAQKWESDRGW